MKVLGVYNFKGGVGKTTAAVNLAYIAAAVGERVLLWDLDAQGGATFMLDIDGGLKGGAKRLMKEKDSLIDSIRSTPYPRLDMLPSDFSLRHMDKRLAGTDTKRLAQLLKPISGLYDLVVMDAPPSMSDLADQIFAVADALLVPLVPTPLSALAFGQLESYIAKDKTPNPTVLPFLSMVDRRKKLHKEMAETFPKSHKGLLKAMIPYSSIVERGAVEQQPVTVVAPKSAAALAYAALWKEVKRKIR